MKRATLLSLLLTLGALALHAQGVPPYTLGRVACQPYSCNSNQYANPGTYLNNVITMSANCFYGESWTIVPGSYVYNCVFPTSLIASAYTGVMEYYENGNLVQAGATFGQGYTYDIIGGNYSLIWQMSVVSDCWNDTPRYYKPPPVGC